MKKFLICGVLVLSLVGLTGCGNRQVFDTTYNFNKAIVRMPDGEVVEYEIKSWKDYDGEQLQITTKDGTTYVVNSNNCVLVSD